MMQSARTYVRELSHVLSEHADSAKADEMSAYMRSQFAFYGVTSPVRRALTRQFIHDNGLPGTEWLDEFVRLVWMAEQREVQYVGMELLYRVRARYTIRDMDLLEYCITHKSWWDTVDFLASKCVGSYYTKFPEQGYSMITQWIRGDNMWLHRTAIIFQLTYRDQTDLSLLTQAILPHVDSKEFFLQKAIGWALRQYSYYDADWVRKFIRTHPMKPLSVREAMKAIRRDGL